MLFDNRLSSNKVRRLSSDIKIVEEKNTLYDVGHEKLCRTNKIQRVDLTERQSPDALLIADLMNFGVD